MRLVLFHQLRLKRSGSVARCCQLKTARSGFDGFATSSIPAIGRLRTLQMRRHFGPKRSLRQLLYQWRQDAILTCEALAILQRGKRRFKIKFFSHVSFLFFSLQK